MPFLALSDHPPVVTWNAALLGVVRPETVTCTVTWPLRVDDEDGLEMLMLYRAAWAGGAIKSAMAPTATRMTAALRRMVGVYMPKGPV
jgi:hypothetical protein